MKTRTILPILGVVLSVSCVNNKVGIEPIEPINAPFEMVQPTRPEFPDQSFNIVDYEAVADSVTLNTDAFARAINACSETGGGKVIVPSGIWLTGPIELKSNINLYLQEGAEIRFTTGKKNYFLKPANRPKGFIPEYHPEYLSPEQTPIPLISAYDCSNIAITGKGTINGQGMGWWPLQPRWWSRSKDELGQELYEKAYEGLELGQRYTRPFTIEPTRCHNVLIEGITVVNGPFHMVHPLMCENVIIRGLKILASAPTSGKDTPNTDGINPESCKNVLIEHCKVYTGDDSFAIKSGKNEVGRRRGKPCENVVIRHCQGRRIAIGSEMSGGVRNVFVDDCTLSGGNNSVIHIKTQRGRGGVVENIWMQNIKAGPVQKYVIKLDMEYYAQGGLPETISERTPKFQNLHFKNIKNKNGKKISAVAILVNGLSEMPIENISFDSISISSKKGIVCRNVRGIEFRDMEINPLEGPVMQLDNCQDVMVSEFSSPKELKPFMTIEGKQSKNIRLDQSLSKYKNDIIFENGSDEKALEYISSTEHLK